MKATFIKLLEFSDKSSALHSAVSALRGGDLLNSYALDPLEFATIPKSPFCYWVSSDVRSIFENRSPLGSEGRIAASGGKTLDDFRWIRASWEVTAEQNYWRGFAKGGEFSPYYADIFLRLDWKNDGKALKAYLVEYRAVRGWSPNWTAELHGSGHYGRPGLTWSRRTQGGLSLRIMPADCIFGDKGPALFVPGDNQEELLALAAVANSRPFQALVALQMAFGSYEVGVLQRTPVPAFSGEQKAALSGLARDIWSRSRKLDGIREHSKAFVLPAALQKRADPTLESFLTWERWRTNTLTWLEEARAAVDEICFAAYGITGGDRSFMEGDLRAQLSFEDDETFDADDEEPSTAASSDLPSTADEMELPDSSLISWAVGVVFCRFDIRLATGERAIPQEADPFDPPPAKSPGMLPDGNPPFMPTLGVLVDDPGHTDDLAARVTAVFERVGESAPAPNELRRSLARDFFPTHIRMYSKSRRKAPIYWQLATPAASYSVWLYVHACTKDTLFRVQNDYLSPKLRDERQQLDRLRVDGGVAPTTVQSRAIETQATFVEELASMLEEVRRVAPLWDADLDDGVILNFAPLWRLVPQNRTWQKECRTAWESLAKGDYDWAHIAMRLWPERVVPKCAKDRSLAIAHNLEEVFWVEGADGKWTSRKAPTRPIDDLIAERTSPAVKAALASLLDAPEPVTASRRRGRAAG